MKVDQNICSTGYVDESTPPLKPPNGSVVTNSELYQALYTLDQRMADRDTAFMNQIAGLATGLENHRSDRTIHGNSEVIKEEIKLDAKKVGLASAFLAICGTFATFFVALIKGKWGL